MSEVRFDGRVVVVTGAGRGMGREFATLLASRGAAVVVNDVRPGGPDDPDTAANVAALIRTNGGQAIASDASVADPAAAASIVAAAVETYGRIDAVINNAGNRIFRPFDALGDDALLALFNVHVRGAWNTTLAAWPHFLAQGGGRVLNVSSADGTMIGVPHHAGYGTCKAALTGMTRELGVEGAPLNIRVNALLPGAATPDGMGAVEGVDYRPPIDVSASSVAPGACWLIHEDCTAVGDVFSCSSGRMARVLTVAAEGWQSNPSTFTLESVRDNWARIDSTDNTRLVRDIAMWNEFRTSIYRRVLGAEGANA